MMLTMKSLKTTSIAALTVAALAATPALATNFPSQSLIIPTQSSYQDACGMVSTYGLVYSVLRANDGLRASGTTSGNFTAPITIHWVFSSVKASPNRCVPTNIDSVFAGSTAVATNTPALSDATWNDGCDFSIVNVNGAPVSLVTNTLTDPGHDTNVVTNDTTSGVGPALAFPNFKSRTVVKTASTSTNVTTVQYAGGAFVISATDAPGFLDLISGVATAKDSAGNVIDFSAFKSNSTTCAVSTNGSGQAVFAGGSLAFANVHKVNIHRANGPFTAEDNARMNGAPPKIGLLQSVDHDFADENGTSVLTGKNRGDTDPVLGTKIVGTPTGIKGTQLRFYLKSAGLDFNQAGGCPAGAYNDPNTNSYNSATAGFCPNGNGVAGQIYDNLDARDLASGLINGTTNGKPNYSVIWAPHWEGRPWKTSGSTQGCDASCIANAQAALATFLDTTSTPHGFLAECATVGFLEGAVNETEELTYKNLCNPGYTGGNPTSQIANCFPNERYINDVYGTQSLTCQKDINGACLAPGSSGTVAPIGLTHDIADVSRRLDNCTDPTASAGSACIHYANPNSAFSQIGDYRWWSYSGGVSNYTPATAATYTPGTQRLLFTVDSLPAKTVFSASPASFAVADNVTLIQRGGDKNKAQMVYLGGHNYTPDVAGTRIALNTLMALGLVVDHQESAFVGPTIYGDNVVVPTYNRITSSAIPSSYFKFDTSAPQFWQFPYHTGNLRVDSLSRLGTGSFSYNNSAQNYIAVMPPPASRNVFTYLGGRISKTTTDLPTSYQSAFGHGVAQVAWKPVNFDQTSLDAVTAGASFVDAYHIGAVNQPVLQGQTAPTIPVTFPGMVSGANTIADLQEALEQTITAQDLGSDNGASVIEQTAIVLKLASATEKFNTKWLIQMVRGFCYSSSSFTPSNAQCMQLGASNAAELGALVHSQPAVVPASPLIPESPAGKHRPMVAYVGGLDGQLHAFYMSSDGADVGYTGPTTPIIDKVSCSPNCPTGNTSASAIFTNPITGAFPATAAGTELWAFIPPGQLPFLKNNTAQVDSSPAVSDVFGDFDGTGIRTWRTVLVASAGGSNREIFALDVTNPLKPTLLWDIQSSYDSTDANKIPYAPAALANDDTGFQVNAQAFNWQNRCRAADVSAGTCVAAQYVLPPLSDSCTGGVCGRTASGLYNYGHLGASQSVTVGVLRRNNAPVYGAFIATNEAGGNGIYVFGIDLVNGSKLWEWNNPYDRESYKTSNPNKYAGTGNTAPAGLAVISQSVDDQVNLVYVGDDEGSMWELAAEDGINNTGYAVGLGCGDKGGACNFPLNQAYGYDLALFGNADIPQPVSTLPTLFTIRSDVPNNGIFTKYVGQLMLAYGTAGTDAVASLASPVVSGAIHVMPVGPTVRDLTVDLTGTASATKRPHATNQGVDYEAGVFKDGSGTAFFPQALTGGTRVYGSITADQNGRLFFGTTTGSVTDIDSRGTLTGNIYQINTGATTGNALTTIVTGIGGIGGNVGIGVNAAGQSVMVVSTDKDLQVPSPTGGLTTQAGTGTGQIPTTGTTGGLLGWFIRITGRE